MTNDIEWKMVKLGDVATIIRGGSPRPIEDYITNSSVSTDNKKLIADYLSIKDVLKKCKSELKALNLQLLESVKAKYETLTEDETKELVIEKKWFAILAENMITELKNVVQKIVTEVTDLQERYECTLDELETNCNTFSKKVAGYLKELE